MTPGSRNTDDITRQLLSAEPDSISAEVRRIRLYVSGQLDDIRQLLKVDVQKAKAVLEEHVTSIRMIPQIDGKRGHYIAEGEWDLLGGYGEDAANSATKRIRNNNQISHLGPLNGYYR